MNTTQRIRDLIAGTRPALSSERGVNMPATSRKKSIRKPVVALATLTRKREYRVLSMHPPWAWAMFHAGKNIDSRSWSTSYRGPLVIHASAKRYAGEKLAEARRLIAERMGVSVEHIPDTFAPSELVGIADLVDCKRDQKSPWANPDEVHWIFANPKLFKRPIAGVHGKHRVWRWRAQ
jgi:hypothetical protein